MVFLHPGFGEITLIKNNHLLNSQIHKTDWWLPEMGVGGVGERDKGRQKLQTFSFKISKSRGCNIQHSDSIITVNNTI